MSDTLGDLAPSQHHAGSAVAHLLGFGTQVVIDGRAASVEALISRELVASFVLSMLDQVETDNNSPVGEPGGMLSRMLPASAQIRPGVSAVVTRGETAVMLHTFSDIARLTMKLVSARSVPADRVINEFKRNFGVGRHQSHVTSRFRAFPTDGGELERFLVGERAYARLRLDEPLAP